MQTQPNPKSNGTNPKQHTIFEPAARKLPYLKGERGNLDEISRPLRTLLNV